MYDGQLRSHASAAGRSLVLLPVGGNSEDGGGSGRTATGPSATKLPQQQRLVRRGSGLTVVPVRHAGNLQASDEEVAAVVAVVEELTDPTRTRLRGVGHSRQAVGGVRGGNGEEEDRALTLDDIVIVSPFNLQVILSRCFFFFLNLLNPWINLQSTLIFPYPVRCGAWGGARVKGAQADGCPRSQGAGWHG